ncbi:sulfiredoxin [Thermosynechococcaceae cyanobacterium BACA0444]|uniref:sulfiredoxin n=1 Tax=Pseudocalidococcus azoricus BACA0444 TaxID=2918990 RepID=A0AAE4FQ61_9CYAN|nr:sulfiredoxin [Pseudocalidococcus azoricus]MDS3859628.1 sulfiredoxin [Pseudocalidococcus azoricus BACA0444]
MRILDIPLAAIRRPLRRDNDSEKVRALMESIAAIGQQEPIDVLEVDGQYYGFSGCHRYEACQRLGQLTIRCKVRRASAAVLKFHLA